MPSKIQNRYTAFLLHFSISLFIFSIFIFALLNLWYPNPYFMASGGWQGLKIVAAIDLVLGPVLTLIIYSKKKSIKELYIDFSLIACLQIAALWWGIITVYEQRPIAAVFWEDGFYTVPASALKKQEINISELSIYGSKKPVYIFARPPQTIAEHEEMLDDILKKHIPPYQQIERFAHLQYHYDDIFKHNLNIDEIISKNSDMKKEIHNVLQKSGTLLHDNYYIALKSKYRNIILVFGRSRQLIGTASAPFKDIT